MRRRHNPHQARHIRFWYRLSTSTPRERKGLVGMTGILQSHGRPLAVVGVTLALVSGCSGRAANNVSSRTGTPAAEITSTDLAPPTTAARSDTQADPSRAGSSSTTPAITSRPPVSTTGVVAPKL